MKNGIELKLLYNISDKHLKILSYIYTILLMDKVDLNVENYNLNEILELFKLDYDFNSSDLKKAKRVVLMTHPDKSKLPKEYFLFYTKA